MAKSRISQGGAGIHCGFASRWSGALYHQSCRRRRQFQAHSQRFGCGQFSAFTSRLQHCPSHRRREHGLSLERLHALAEAGIIGSVASNAYSFMGYIPRPAALMEKTAPAIAEEMTHDNVDLVLLVPA
ncbi:MAG: hypothetical protein R3D26_17160 [Cyanobacteriota/Melainabacteria group bacterium]